jgi:hypothetical protein
MGGFDPIADAYITMSKAVILNTLYEPSPAKIDGSSWPGQAMSMAGLRRLNNLHALIEDTIAHNIPGDFIETGVWKGGLCAFVAVLYTAYDQWPDRHIWLADSFRG